MKMLVSWDHLVNMKMLKLPGIIIIISQQDSTEEVCWKEGSKDGTEKITTRGSHLFRSSRENRIGGNSGKVKTKHGSGNPLDIFDF